MCLERRGGRGAGEGRGGRGAGEGRRGRDTGKGLQEAVQSPAVVKFNQYI